MKIRNPYLRASIVTPAVFLVATVVYGCFALRLAPLAIDGQLSESFFPLLVSMISLPTCIVLIVSGVKEARKEVGEREVQLPLKAVLVALDIGVFLFLFAHFGFTLASPVFVFLFMLIYDDKPQGFLRKLVYTLCIVAFVYVLYEICFDVRFPEIWR